jgi:hypothetical protein
MAGKYDDLCITDEIHKKDIVLGDGKKRTMYFREMDTVAFRKFQIAEGSADEDERAAAIPRLVAASLCEPDGSPALTLAEAKRLKPKVSNALMAAILEINNPKKDAGKG